MAYPTAVNNQITDSVSQVNLKVLGDSPAMSMGEVYVATSQALSNAAHNATTNQQQTGVTSGAANVQGLGTLYSLGTAPTATTNQQKAGVISRAANAQGLGTLYSLRTAPAGVAILGLDVLPPGLGTRTR